MGKCYFNNAWLHNQNYRHWLSASKSNRRAMCRWCKKEFDVGNMGEAAIKSHATSKKHILLQTLEQSDSKRTIMDSFKSGDVVSLCFVSYQYFDCVVLFCEHFEANSSLVYYACAESLI